MVRFCAQVRQGQQAAIAAGLFHRRAASLGQGHEAVGADVVSDAETLTGGGVSESSSWSPGQALE